MNRFITLIVSLTLLLLMVPVSIPTKAATLGDKPFYCVNMSEPADNLEYVYWLPYLWTAPLQNGTDWPSVSCYGSHDDRSLAEGLKRDMNARPEGSRYFQLTLVQTAFHTLAENAIYLDKAAEFTKEWVVSFLDIYKSIGGKLDGIIVDLEYIDSHAYYLYDFYVNNRGKGENKHIYWDVVEDPRYATQVRPLLEKYGFEFYTELTDEKSEIWCINTRDKSITGHEDCYNIWNHVTDIMEREAINEAVYYPLIERYPNANLSDYQSTTQNTWLRSLDTHGREVILNTVAAGNTTNWNLYIGFPENQYYGTAENPTYKKPPSFNDAIFEAKPFNVFMYETNYFKNMLASSKDGNIDAWLAHYQYGIGNTGHPTTYSGTPYYSEIVYHVGLLNPKSFLGYMIVDVNNATRTANDLMKELTRVAGASDRKPLAPQPSWNGSYVLTGMYAAGRNIWRLTPDTSVVSLKDFKVSDNDPTFSVDGVTITFPGGKILKDSNIYQAGSCGFWIETDKDVEPIVTASDDRYRNNPAFLEDFENYRDGASFTSAWAKPTNCWEVKGTAKVREADGNKVLALSNNTTIKNLKIPANITAGDDYAKQQAWEVTVTLPDDFGSGASINLLACFDGDKGIRLSGSGAYYGSGDSEKLIEGVTLTAGNTYTVRRELDFRSAGNYTSDYAIYDVSGKLLGEVKGVATPIDSLPVAEITMSVSGVNNPVLLDNYKLYPTGVSTVLGLYEAEDGRIVKDPERKTSVDTAYRVSWLNASNEDTVAYVYDAISGNVVQEIKMKAGMDGVVTGIYDVEGGKTVQLSVSQGELPSTDNTKPGVDVPPENEDPTTGTEPTVATEATEPTVDNTDATEPSSNDDTSTSEPTISNEDMKPNDNKKQNGSATVITVIVSAIVAAAIAVGAFFVIKKKRKTITNLDTEASNEDITEIETEN